MGCTQSEISPQNEAPKKGCTDILWLVIYVIFWILMIIVACISFVYGNPQRLINGFDSFGNTCGVSSNKKLVNFPLAGISTLDKNYLFFMDVKELKRCMKICVKKCPDREMKSLADLQTFYKETGSNLCRYDVTVWNITSTKDLHTFSGPCPTLPVYESVPILNRCVPKNAAAVGSKVITEFYKLLNSWDMIEQILSDLYSSWKEMVICLIVAFLCSLVVVSILHYMVSLVSWIIMIVVSIVSVIGTAFLWYTYYELRMKHKLPDVPFLSESLQNEKAFLWYSIIATIITIIILLLVFVLRNRVSRLADLFEQTAHCLGSIPALFLQPIITCLILVVFLLLWSTVVVCLATANYPTIPYRTNFFFNVTPQTQIDNYSLAAVHKDKDVSYKNFTAEPIDFDPLWVKSMWWMCLISLIWGSEFILGCQQMTIAGAVTCWYFRRTNPHPSPVLYSIGKLIKYHLGSVAKGSFLITLFKIPRLILTYLHAKLSSRAEKGSECAKCALKCGICCLYCLEKFIRYLNHNAYTIITIERCHFCKAAARAFNTLTSNALMVATINSVGDFILFLGKCIVTAVTGIIGLFLLKRNPDLNFYAIPTLVICIYAFFIAHCILSLYEMVVDTLFICVCEDRNMNPVDGNWKSTKIAELGGHRPDKNRSEQEEEEL